MAEDTVDRFADVGIEMRRMNNLHILVRGGDFRQRTAEYVKPDQSFHADDRSPKSSSYSR